MITVIVAEDKHPILRNIVQKIENYHPDLRVIGEATDGLSALELCLRLKPQIVFTDIRMPGMDGLELITELKNKLPDTQFIIISGYNDFEYAREAMRIGVTEFLLKPVNQQSIYETLEKVIQSVHMKHVAKEHQLLSNLLRGRPLDKSLTSHVESDDRSYYLLLICAGPISRFLIDLANPFYDFWLQNDLVGFLSRQVNNQFENSWVFDGESLNEVIIILSCKKEEKIDFTEIYHTFHHQFKQSHQLFTFAVSKPTEKLTDIRLEYQLTRMILSKNLIFGKSSLLFVKDFSLHSQFEPELEQTYDKQKIASLVKNKKKESFLLEMESSFKRWEELHFTQSAVEFCLSQILYHASQSALDKPIVNNDLKLELDEVISISKDYRTLLKNMNFIFDHFFPTTLLSEPHSSSVRLIMERVDAYFKDHLSEEIAIAEVADMVNFNVSFLSREFKKYKGSTPIEYLTHLRIQKAKQLLLDSSNLKSKDIAALVGYSNQYYFSKVFKLITGLTPTEYKSTKQDELTS